jgi:hypothetical protein
MNIVLILDIMDIGLFLWYEYVTLQTKRIVLSVVITENIHREQKTTHKYIGK